MEEEQKERFYLISLLSAYLLVKDQDINLSEINQEDEKKYVDLLAKSLSLLDGYTHLPNKNKIIKSGFRNLIDYIENGDINEENLLSKVKKSASAFDLKQKNFVLNSVVYVAYQDDKVTDSEKESIVQVAYFLGLETDFNNIIKGYKCSEFAPKLDKKYKIMALSFVLIAGLTLAFVFILIAENSKNTLKVFNQERIVFNEIALNRMVTYTNKYNITDEHFLKQAVIYFHGSAEVSFDPNQLNYNHRTKSITISFTEDRPFKYKLQLTPHTVDVLNPKSISSEEAMKVSAVVGVAGAFAGGIVGNKLGGLVGSVLPSGASFLTSTVTTGAGAVIGGAGAAFMSFKTLDGIELTKEFSQRERDEVIENSQKLIKALLMTNPDVDKIIKQNFELFIKQVYAAKGIEVLTIEYQHEEKEAA